VVATPIGNLEDLSSRARSVLATVDVVACEDTRRTGALLAHLGLRRRLLSVHEHNERRRIEEILARLAEGGRVALVSDAGTPLLADPGFPLVRAAIEAGHAVVAVPGASAVLAALVCSGLPPYPFTFCGFPPRRAGKRRTFFERFASLDHTLLLLESPHRILETLEEAAVVLGDRPAVVCRELTKLHEETLRGTLRSLGAALAARDQIRGELVVVIAGSDSPANGDDSEEPEPDSPDVSDFSD
jgi:16S rRNA (cytidine1402-2'-O)-methyltransferase